MITKTETPSKKKAARKRKTKVENAVAKHEEKHSDVVAAAMLFKVTSQNTFIAVGNFVHDTIIPMEKEIKATFDPICKQTNEAHKASTKARSAFLEPLSQAKKLVKDKAEGWWSEQKALREEEERKIEREHQAQMEAEAAQRAAEAANIDDDEIDFEDMGSPLSDPMDKEEFVAPTPMRVAAPMPDKPKGMTMSEVTEPECFDFLLLVKAVASGQAPIELLDLNTKKLREQCKAMGGNLNYPGVRVTKKPRAGFRSS
jgi:hypothetical protein